MVSPTCALVPVTGNAGDSSMTEELRALVERARGIEMTPAELREQRQSFVFGNTKIENDLITREMVSEIDQQIEEEGATRS